MGVADKRGRGLMVPRWVVAWLSAVGNDVIGTIS